MQDRYDVAIVGATGLVGGELLHALYERGFPVGEVHALASAKSLGKQVSFGGTPLDVADANTFDYSRVDLVLMSAGKLASQTLAERAALAGAYVIDNGSHFRMDADVPLVVPEVNPEAILGASTRRIVANPNCSTIQLVVALAPLCARAKLTRVVASTYQAVSGAGQQGIEALARESRALLCGEPPPEPHFSRRIAFNCVPHIDELGPRGTTFEEEKMVRESRKILCLAELGMVATCVRVPVFNGHGVSVVAEFDGPMNSDIACAAWAQGNGVIVASEPAEAPYPTSMEAVGQDATLVGRVRDDPSRENSIAFWCMADNLRKGAATNAVQVAELVVRRVARGELPRGAAA